MEVIKVNKIDEVHNKIICDPGIAYELNEYFTFDVPGAKFMPAYRNKVWDGKIRLFNVMSCTLYGGLNHQLDEFGKSRGYEIEYSNDFASEEFSLKEANDFVESLNIPEKFERRDYQLDAFTYAVRNRRALMLSPTASGKSFIIYLLVRYYEEYLRDIGCRTLIIVPTTSLVHQLSSDFIDYGYPDAGNIHRVFAGQDKNTDHAVVISTWQSLYKLPKTYFNSFNVIIGDEAHLFKAKSLTSIMSKLTECKYRFGFTGTLDNTQTHKLVLEGLFGAVRRVTQTSDLIEQGHLSQFLIKCIVLKYSDEYRKLVSKMDYQAEMDWLVRCDTRNRFIKNLTLSLEGNTLLLFQYVDKHGKVLYDMLKGDNTHFVYGGVDGAEREEIRHIVEQSTSSIIVASYGTFSTGINIRNLHNIIFASPSKSKIRVLQSIGRGLRKSDTKDVATLYDISDDLIWKSKKNFTIQHFAERVKNYNEEKFDYKIYPVNLKVD
jgi:superfamily II DNA or RNA helicase